MRKISRLVFSTIALLSVTSCAKLSADEAKERAKKYDPEAAVQKYESATVKTTSRVSKAEGIFSALFTVGEKTEERTVSSRGFGEFLVDADEIVEMGNQEGMTYTYEPNGANGLIIKAEISIDKVAKQYQLDTSVMNVTGGSWSVTKINDEGLVYYQETSTEFNYEYKADLKIDGLDLSGAAKGGLKMSSVTEVTFKAKA